MRITSPLSVGPLLWLALGTPCLSSPAFAQTAPPPPPPLPPPAPTKSVVVEMSTLRLLRDKGVLSQAEYDSALRDLAESSGSRVDDDTTVAVGKFATTIYGFVDADAIWDSTQSFGDIAGGTMVATPSSYGGQHSRMTFSARFTRFGIRIKAPEMRYFRASGVVETDFEDTTLPVGSGEPYLGTESAYLASPTFRLRAAYLKFETPVVDILFGQQWHLFGGGPAYFPATVGIQGIPGDIFNRTTQLRLSKTMTTDNVTVEVAAAASRPPQRNAGVPEGAFGVRLSFPKWSGMQTINSTGTQIAPLSFSFTGDVRKVAVAEWAAKPVSSNDLTGSGVAFDVFVPVLPATSAHKGNSRCTWSVCTARALRTFTRAQQETCPLRPRCPTRAT